MKAKVKSWEETKNHKKIHRMVKKYCGTVIPIHYSPLPYHKKGEWYYHDLDFWGFSPDWLEIIDEDAEVAEIYVLLLIESGEI